MKPSSSSKSSYSAAPSFSGIGGGVRITDAKLLEGSIQITLLCTGQLVPRWVVGQVSSQHSLLLVSTIDHPPHSLIRYTFDSLTRQYSAPCGMRRSGLVADAATGFHVRRTMRSRAASYGAFAPADAAAGRLLLHGRCPLGVAFGDRARALFVGTKLGGSTAPQLPTASLPKGPSLSIGMAQHAVTSCHGQSNSCRICGLCERVVGAQTRCGVSKNLQSTLPIERDVLYSVLAVGCQGGSFEFESSFASTLGRCRRVSFYNNQECKCWTCRPRPTHQTIRTFFVSNVSHAMAGHRRPLRENHTSLMGSSTFTGNTRSPTRAYKLRLPFGGIILSTVRVSSLLRKQSSKSPHVSTSSSGVKVQLT